MYTLIKKDGYKPLINLRDTQRAIKFLKDDFELNLAAELNLERISAPLIVTKASGLNDDLSGVERKVSFDFKEMSHTGEVVQSLAKWKRCALKKYGFKEGEGLYTDMNAIRRDDCLDNTHSVFVDQWDWEKVINKSERTLSYLYQTVEKIVRALYITNERIVKRYPALKQAIGKEVFFISSQQLEDLYPSLTAKEREREITKEHRTVFISGIGKKLSSGKPHDLRAPDYDDWDLNGDLLMWNECLDDALELSSMGIRVDENSLISQLNAAGAADRLQFDYHKKIASGKLPLTIGGGIGQSRLCMLMLQKLHIGEVQASIWPPEMLAECEEQAIDIL